MASSGEYYILQVTRFLEGGGKIRELAVLLGSTRKSTSSEYPLPNGATGRGSVAVPIRAMSAMNAANGYPTAVHSHYAARSCSAGLIHAQFPLRWHRLSATTASLGRVTLIGPPPPSWPPVIGSIPTVPQAPLASSPFVPEALAGNSKFEFEKSALVFRQLKTFGSVTYYPARAFQTFPFSTVHDFVPARTFAR